MANQYYCTNGQRVTEGTIQRNYSKSLKTKHAGTSVFVCGGCGQRAVHNDHTIAKARCKVLHKTELIWHPNNYVNACATCHRQWENFKSGEWINHLNVDERLKFLKEHDPEGFTIRIEFCKLTLEQQLYDEHPSKPERLGQEVETS